MFLNWEAGSQHFTPQIELCFLLVPRVSTLVLPALSLWCLAALWEGQTRAPRAGRGAVSPEALVLGSPQECFCLIESVSSQFHKLTGR